MKSTETFSFVIRSSFIRLSSPEYECSMHFIHRKKKEKAKKEIEWKKTYVCVWWVYIAIHAKITNCWKLYGFTIKEKWQC